VDEVDQVKQSHRAMWAAGDYGSLAPLIWEVGAHVVSATGAGPGDEVLDVACGTGNAAIQAAQAGATVTGLDLTAELLEGARAGATEAGVAAEWVEGDAEALPFEDASFDVVVSTFGCMFAPRHAVVAAELARVLRPEGRLGVCAWTPEGAIGDFFATVGSHMPPPPPVVEPPLRWGVQEHVEETFAGTGVDLEFARESVRFRFPSVEDAVTMYEAKFGPIVKARELLEPQGTWQALRDDLGAMFARQSAPDGDGVVSDAEYLLILGRRVA
jgi:ubiquinone/menaquinone biosynthesis C-methylase UbiE